MWRWAALWAALMGAWALVGLLLAVAAFAAAPANAAPACPFPDPTARPVVRLAAGELRELAALAWGEARGDGYCGMLGVSAVVVNRMRRDPRQFGATVTQVINKPFAFSVFGKRDPNAAKVAKVDESNPAFLVALLAALAAIGGADNTGGADHFHASGEVPGWARGMPATVRIGGHTFRRAGR